MIVLDSSSIVAILNDEPERATLLDVVASSDENVVSAVTFYETSIVVYARHREEGLAALTAFLHTHDIKTLTFTKEDAEQALLAFKRYGKGQNAKSRLNFGDGASYALAKKLDAPLLFKGDDFTATDVKRC